MANLKHYLNHPMFRPVILVVGVVIVFGVMAVVHHFSGPPSPYTTVDACDILTADIAHQLGGSSLTQEQIKPQATDDTVTTYCVYRGTSTTVALIVRSPKTAKGIAQNRSAFSPLPGGVQQIRGYGDAAFWTPTFAQLNILSHNRWYILSNGQNVPSQRTLRDSQNLAGRITDQL